MSDNHFLSRRALVRSSVFGLLAVPFSRLLFAGPRAVIHRQSPPAGRRYPAIEDAVVAEVVGASHFNLDRVKELVDARPELARACWDWAYGDFETALGAASHVGRRDIATYLMSKGARPDIFTYAMLGSLEAVQAMIAATPGIQSVEGPHGISLLQHARNGLRAPDLSKEQQERGEALVSYLEGLGDADPQLTDLPMEPEEKEAFLGDYLYGKGLQDGLSVRLNMRNMLSLGRLGAFGGALFQTAPGTFAYNGAPSVKVVFEKHEGRVVALTVHEPDLVIRAKKVSS